MEVTQNPEFSLSITGYEDMHMLFHFAIPYARKKADKETKKRLDAVLSDLTQVDFENQDSENIYNLQSMGLSQVPHTFIGKEAQLVASAIATFVRDKERSTSAVGLERLDTERLAAEHGRLVLNMIATTQPN